MFATLQRIRIYFVFKLAQIYLRHNKISKSIQIFQNIIQLYPKHHISHFYLGIGYAQTQKFSHAVHHYQQALQGNDHNAVYHLFLGRAFYEQGNYEAAQAAFQDALQLDAKNTLLHNELALCNLAMGDADTAVTILREKGIFENPDLQIRLLAALEIFKHKTTRGLSIHELENSGSPE